MPLLTDLFNAACFGIAILILAVTTYDQHRQVTTFTHVAREANIPAIRKAGEERADYHRSLFIRLLVVLVLLVGSVAVFMFRP